MAKRFRYTGEASGAGSVVLPGYGPIEKGTVVEVSDEDAEHWGEGSELWEEADDLAPDDTYLRRGIGEYSDKQAALDAGEEEAPKRKSTKAARSESADNGEAEGE